MKSQHFIHLFEPMINATFKQRRGVTVLTFTMGNHGGANIPGYAFMQKLKHLLPGLANCATMKVDSRIKYVFTLLQISKHPMLDAITFE